MFRRIGVGLVLAALTGGLCAPPAAALERRKAQFLSEPAYLYFPLPYRIPGIGEGFFVTAFGSNVADTYTDLYAVGITGDAVGAIVGVSEWHLIHERLFVDFEVDYITSAAVNQYKRRGMESRKNDFDIIEVRDVVSTYAQATWTLMERRLEFRAEVFDQRVDAIAVRDPQGELIGELSPADRFYTRNRELGVLWDDTDDRLDPRVGYRMGLDVAYSPPQASEEPRYYVVDTALTGYIPVGRLSTLGLHLFRSDAVVVSEGDTDPASVRADLGLFCGSPPDPVCEQSAADIVRNTVAANKYGTATPLGGLERLRAYPDGRFQGAHTLFLSAEFRWNLTEEFTPFDYFVWKDVRTGVQVAFFTEMGSVADTVGELGRHWRSATGVGGRLVSGSGVVYRADVAAGQEGTETSIFINYPW